MKYIKKCFSTPLWRYVLYRGVLYTLAVMLFCVTCFENNVYAAQSTTEKKAPPKVKLFGSIEFRGNIKTLKQWASVKERHKKNPIFTPNFKLNSNTTWDKLKEQTKGKSLLNQIKIVNTFWNQWPYRQDKDVYRKLDYWAAPYQFKKNSGDCEDYAIAKYYTLRELGFPMERLRVVVVKDTILNLAHAILAVYLDDNVYILDNLTRSVFPHTRFKNYIPQYSINEKHRWMHIKPKK